MTVWLHVHTRDRAISGSELCAPAPLYAGHELTGASAAALTAWARSAGLSPADGPHVTVAASRAPVDPRRVPRLSAGMVVRPGGRSLAMFGNHLVLLLDSPELRARHEEYRRAGATWDFPTYQPHVTVAKRLEAAPEGLAPFDEPIVLGPELQSVFDDY